jgi:TolB protein
MPAEMRPIGMLNTFRASVRTSISAVSPLWLACALAAICFASPLGIFESDTSVTLGQFAGHAAFNPSTEEYSLMAAGGEISGKADGFQYLWKRVTGDVTLNADARFAGTGYTGRSQAALMIRQSLDPDAAYAAAVILGDGRTLVQYRVDKGAASRSYDLAANADVAGLVHLSIHRQGDGFTIAMGRMGKIGGSIPVATPVTVTMSGPVFVGLALASPDDAKRQMGAIFSNVSVQRPAGE